MLVKLYRPTRLHNGTVRLYIGTVADIGFGGGGGIDVTE